MRVGPLHRHGVFGAFVFCVGRITPTVIKRAFDAGSDGLPRSPVVTRRASPAESSPALRSKSESVPTVAASAIAALGDIDLERNRFDDRRLVGLLVGDLIDRQHRNVFDDDVRCRHILLALPRQQHIDVIAGQYEAGNALDVVDADGDRLLAGPSTAESVARCPGPVIFEARTASLTSIGISTMRFSAVKFGDLAESAGRQCVRRPRLLAQRRELS